MIVYTATTRLFRKAAFQCGVGVTAAAIGALPIFAAAPPAARPIVVAPAPAAEETPPALDPDAAIRWALTHNPEIAALRQQHGIAVAGIIIADTYPFNPVWESSVRGDFGPPSAGVTSSVANTQRIGIDLELRGQMRIRREAAAAALTRTDWEIANQEVGLAVRVLRAFDSVVYRFRKRMVIEQGIKLNEAAAKQVEKLRDKPNGTTGADAVFINTEVVTAKALLVPGNAALAAAWQDLYRTLGLTQGTFDLLGGFEAPAHVDYDVDQLLQAALERRTDLRAHQVAVNEADARVRLEVANKFGNPNVGPAYEYNETRTQFIGVQFTLPLPVLNTHRGDIQQREAERTRAVLELRQNEISVRQDVRAALMRLEQARKLVDTYHNEVVPSLEAALKDIQTRFEASQPGADLLRVIDVQRKLLQARDAELDAIFELRQAFADLALAVGDPAVAVRSMPNP